MHMIQPPGTAPPVLLPHPFAGILDRALSPDVNVMGLPAATVGSGASNRPPHAPSNFRLVATGQSAERLVIVVDQPATEVEGARGSVVKRWLTGKGARQGPPKAGRS